jgi:DNA repair exonuclease SbcCD ATPase subunit
MEIKELRSILDKQKGKKEEIEKQISEYTKVINTKTEELHNHEKALEIIKIVGIATQQQLQFQISNITSMALESVFDDPYQLAVEFVESRNSSECEINFVRDENKIDPLSSSGYGAVDVAAFALRIACWSMQNPHSRPVLILDEPFKHLKGIEQNKKVLRMIREISKRLNLQILMISDERIPKEDIIENADRVFEVSIKNGISKVTVN